MDETGWRRQGRQQRPVPVVDPGHGCRRDPERVIRRQDDAEERGLDAGALQVVNESALLRVTAPRYGVVAEPTRMVPVYAHKGGASVQVIAEGIAAHTSLDRGISANFLIAPFLAEMAQLAGRLKGDTSYGNALFDPPTLGFNMTLDGGGCKQNVTAARTVATLSMRPMPNDRSAEVIAEIVARAERHGFATKTSSFPPFSVSPDATIVRAALAATDEPMARVVPYGTEAFVYQDRMEVVILGPGDIAQAHTNGEWIELSQLARAVEVYSTMIANLCR
jgi:acetylornithine deacetylase